MKRAALALTGVVLLSLTLTGCDNPKDCPTPQGLADTAGFTVSRPSAPRPAAPRPAAPRPAAPKPAPKPVKPAPRPGKQAPRPVTPHHTDVHHYHHQVTPFYGGNHNRNDCR